MTMFVVGTQVPAVAQAEADLVDLAAQFEDARSKVDAMFDRHDPQEWCAALTVKARAWDNYVAARRALHAAYRD